MNEIDQINEELRHYKLFKIQRLSTKNQKFNEFNRDLKRIKRNEIISYIIAIINIASITFFIYQLFECKFNIHSLYFENNYLYVIGNFLLVLVLSFYLTYKYLFFVFKLKKYIKLVDEVIEDLNYEDKLMKNNYEGYVNNYLEKEKRNRR